MDARTADIVMGGQGAGVVQPPPPLKEPLDLQRLAATVRRRLRLLVGLSLVIFLAVAAYTFTTTPRYTATARVMIDPRQEKVVDAQQMLSGLPGDVTAIDTQVEVLRSHALAERLAAKLQLERDAEFNPSLAPKGLFGFGTQAPTPLPRNDADLAVLRQKVADALLRHVKISRAGLTSVIDVSVTSVSPARAAELANGLVAIYLGDQLDTKFDATRRANAWLNDRLDGLRNQVESAESAVQAYKSANGLLSAEGNTLTEQAISGLNGQIAEARAQQAEAEARLNTATQQLAKGSTGEDVGEALSSQVIQQLRTQRAEVSRTVADLQGRYGPRHPDMLKAQRQLADIDTQIQSEVRRVLTNLQSQAQVARQRTASLQGSLSSSRGTLVANNSATVKLNELQRNAESVRTLYQSYLDRFKQTSEQQGIQQSDARILSPARAPRAPSIPNVPLNLGLGAVLAIGAGLASVFLMEAFESGLSTAEDIEQRLGLPALGAIPRLASTLDRGARKGMTPTQAIVEKPLSAFSETFRSLRTSVLFARVGEPVHVIAVTSSLPGEGKTTTCIGLARTMALAGAATVVVDCDLRRRTLDRTFGPDPAIGLIELLNGEATLEQCLILDEASGAWFLPLANSAYTSKDTFGAPTMDRLLEALRGRFDVVLLDTAPVLAVADTRILAAKADAVVFLTQWRKTPRLAVENSLKQLDAVGAFIAGVCLTQVDVREQARTGYGDPGFYYRRFAHYYAN